MRRLLLALMLSIICTPSRAQEITFTAETTTGHGRVVPVLSWSTSPAADSCAASGGWSGEKGASGTEVLPEILTSESYRLDCTWSGGTVTLSWIAPTENVDGSPLTDLAGYNLYYGTVSGEYPESEHIDNPALTTWVIESLPSGTWFFVLTALNSVAVESDFSNEAQVTVDDDSASESIAITVNPQPQAPAGLVAQ